MPLINNKKYSYDKAGFDRYKEERTHCVGRPTGKGYGAARKGPAPIVTGKRNATVSQIRRLLCSDGQDRKAPIRPEERG